MESQSLEKVPGLQEVVEELKSSAVCIGIFFDIITKWYRAFNLVWLQLRDIHNSKSANRTELGIPKELPLKVKKKDRRNNFTEL